MALPGVAVPSLELVFDLLLWGFFAVILLGAWLVKGIVYLWFSVKILRSDALPIELVASTPGPVEISGTARVANEVVQAPISDVECLACEYEIIKQSGGSDIGYSNKTIYEGRTQTQFYVEDDTASVLVNPVGATFNFEEHVTIVDKGDSVPESLRQFLDEHPKYDPNTSWWTSTHSFTERRLEPGEQVHVYGVARYDPTVSKHGGTVNAIIDIPPPPSRSLLARLHARVTTPPFVISDSDERATLRRLLTGAGLQLGLIIAILLFIVLVLSTP